MEISALIKRLKLSKKIHGDVDIVFSPEDEAQTGLTHYQELYWIDLEKKIDYLKSINAGLLAVCKRVITEYEADWDMPQELIQMARQTIAKAEGKEETSIE